MRALVACLLLAGCVAPPASQPEKSNAAASIHPVAASDPYVRFTGRVDRRDPARVRFAYPGVALELAFEGEGLTASFEDHSTNDTKRSNHYEVLLDGKPTTDLAVTPNQRDYVLAEGLEPGPHRVTLYKKTEAIVGASTFLQFGVMNGDELLPLPPRPARRLEIVGDSITCGYGNEASIQPPPAGNPSSGFTAENEDHYRSYAALAARELKAELHTVCVSGIGVTRDYGGKTTDQMPQIFARTLPFEAEPAWSFGDYVPDAVIVNLGTNDFGKGVPDEATFVKAYEAFVADLRTHYPKAHLVCATGTMLSDAWPPGENRLTKINAWVSGIVERRRSSGDAAISFLAMQPQSAPFGEDWHPTLATHERMARELSAHLGKTLGW